MQKAHDSLTEEFKNQTNEFEEYKQKTTDSTLNLLFLHALLIDFHQLLYLNSFIAFVINAYFDKNLYLDLFKDSNNAHVTLV